MIWPLIRPSIFPSINGACRKARWTDAYQGLQPTETALTFQAVSVLAGKLLNILTLRCYVWFRRLKPALCYSGLLPFLYRITLKRKGYEPFFW